MAWFHKKLTDLIAAFEEKDWETAASILEEHDIEIHEKKGERIKLELQEAATHLSRYAKLLSGIRRAISQEYWEGASQRAWPPSDEDQHVIIHKLKMIEVDVKEFERILKRMYKEGKHLE